MFEMCLNSFKMKNLFSELSEYKEFNIEKRLRKDFSMHFMVINNYDLQSSVAQLAFFSSQFMPYFQNSNFDYI